MNTEPEKTFTDTIPLTGRRPVRIHRAQWPVVALARSYSGQHECQANLVAWIIVREHSDGRMLVYGERGAGPGGQAIDYSSWRGGEMVAAADDVAGAVARVVEGLKRHSGYGVIDWDALGDAVLADLPAEGLS